MVEYVKISPLTRLEGHLGITARINDGNVSAAYAHGEMFRGIEKILLKRDPRDAPVITSRTCGVCHFVHRHVSLRNIENAAGFSFPAPQAADAGNWDSQDVPGNVVRWLDANRDMLDSGESPSGDKLPLGAQLARNIVHALTYAYSHAAHTIALAAPDYKALIDQYIQDNAGDSDMVGDITDAEANGNDSFFDNFYNEAVVAQRILHEMLGFLGGKVPHQQSAIPGGFSRSFAGQLGEGGDMDAIATLAGKTIAHGGAAPDGSAAYEWPFLDLTDGLDDHKPLVGNGDSGNASGDWIARRVTPFTLALAVGAHQAGATLWGQGSGNFVCAPTFDVVKLPDDGGITGDAYFRGGAKIVDSSVAGSTSLKKLDPTQKDPMDDDWVTIYEDITSGKYPETDDITEEPNCEGYPGETDTHPATATHGLNERYTYTWYKATRVKDFNGKLFTVESGPFARLVVNNLDPDLNLDGGYTIPGTGITLEGNGLRTDVYEDAVGDASLGMASTTWNRLIGRLQDTLLCVDMLIGSNYSGENESGKWLEEIASSCWLDRLDAAIDAYGGTVDAAVMVQDTPANGVAWEQQTGVAGCAYWDAPRGITCHFCKIDDGAISQYQYIAGTTWNGNGRDAQGNPGPFEWSLMGMTKEETDVDFTGNSGGNFTTSLTGPVCERTVFIKYELKEGSGSWKEYTAKDKPKHDGSEEGQIVGQALKSTSKIDYETGDVTLEFKFHHDYPDYDYMRNVRVDRYGYASNPVPAPAVWNTGGDNLGYGYSHTDDEDKPNPINILRTIRSYDPCLACSIHVVDKKGKVGKYEAVPVAGWEVK